MRKKRKRGGEEGRKGKEGERGERKEREKDLRVLKWRRGRARGDSTIVLVILLCAFREVTLGMASLCPWASPISKHFFFLQEIYWYFWAVYKGAKGDPYVHGLHQSQNFFSCRRSIGTFGQYIRMCFTA